MAATQEIIIEYDIRDYFYKIYENDDVVNSPNQKCGDLNFYLCVHPFGDESLRNENSKERYVSIYLHLLRKKNFKDNWEVNVSCEFILLNKRVVRNIDAVSNYNLNFKNQIFSDSIGYNWGFNKYIKISEIGQYLYGDNDTLRFRVKVIVHMDKTNISPPIEDSIPKNISEMTDDDFSCTICFEKYKNPKILQCGHTFCGSCITSMSRSSNWVTCPFCRKKTKKNNIVPNFMLEKMIK